MQATLTSKGQMTLPVAARARLGLEAGDHLLVIVQGR
jgi:AbrB family looped-hinge helix DNA binding protein